MGTFPSWARQTSKRSIGKAWNRYVRIAFVSFLLLQDHHSPLTSSVIQLEVKYVVSPNYEHLKFAEQWSKEYEDANMWGCPGLAARIPEIDFAGEIPNGFFGQMLGPKLENCWDFDTIVPLHLDIEVNPFSKKPFFNEGKSYISSIFEIKNVTTAHPR